MKTTHRPNLADVAIGGIDRDRSRAPQVIAVNGATRPGIVRAIDEDDALRRGVDPRADTLHQLAAVPLVCIDVLRAISSQYSGVTKLPAGSSE